MERLLSVSRELQDKVQQNESAAGELLRQCEELKEELKAMRQWREVVPSSEEENRVQIPNIEFKYIKQLQAENSELRVLLEEHQAAIEMIMNKYRQQVGQFIDTERQEKTLTNDTTADELLHRTDQLYNMAAAVTVAMQEDDTTSQKAVEYISQLECENRHLRELLHFTQSGVLDSSHSTSDHTPSEGSAPFPPNSRKTSTEGVPRRHNRKQPPSITMQEGGGDYVSTPINSGQATPIAPPTEGGEGAQPVLQEVCDKLSSSSLPVV